MPRHQTAISLFSLVVDAAMLLVCSSTLTQSAFRINAMPSKFCFRGEALNRLYSNLRKRSDVQQFMQFLRTSKRWCAQLTQTCQQICVHSTNGHNIRCRGTEKRSRDWTQEQSADKRVAWLWHHFNLVVLSSSIFCIHNFPARWLECWRCRRAWWDRIPFDHEPANVANVVGKSQLQCSATLRAPPVDSSPRGPLGSLRRHPRNRDVGIFQYEQILWYEIFTQSVAWHVL